MTPPISAHVALREALPEDAAELGETQVRSWQKAYRGLVPQSYLDGISVEAWSESWRRRLAAPAGPTFVVTERGAVVGFANFGPSRDPDKDPRRTCELYSMYLRPEMQGRGHGRVLFERGLAWAAQHAFKEMSALVLDGNRPARDFYARMGMRDDGFSVSTVIGGHAALEVRLVRPLATP